VIVAGFLQLFEFKGRGDNHDTIFAFPKLFKFEFLWYIAFDMAIIFLENKKSAEKC